MAGETFPIIDESVQTRDGREWVHKVCGTILMGKTVTHSIHDGPSPLSGSGETVTEVVPYCPACEGEPSAYGKPLPTNPHDEADREILSRMRRL